jgi:hypothetical protein
MPSQEVTIRTMFASYIKFALKVRDYTYIKSFGVAPSRPSSKDINNREKTIDVLPNVALTIIVRTTTNHKIAKIYKTTSADPVSASTDTTTPTAAAASETTVTPTASLTTCEIVIVDNETVIPSVAVNFVGPITKVTYGYGDMDVKATLPADPTATLILTTVTAYETLFILLDETTGTSFSMTSVDANGNTRGGSGWNVDIETKKPCYLIYLEQASITITITATA